MRISPLEWGLVRPADFFCALNAYHRQQRDSKEYEFLMLRSAVAKIVYPFLKESGRHSDLDKFWPNPFAQVAQEKAPMTEEDRMKSIAKLLKKLNHDGAKEESES